jgi:hypothetical protein
MIEIIGTLRENLENYVLDKVNDKIEAESKLQDLRSNPNSRYVRFFARTEIPVIELKFCEIEQEIIVYALKKLTSNEIQINGENFAICATNLLAELQERNQIPWVDIDTLSVTLDKLKKLTAIQSQRMIDHFRSKI